MANFITKKTTDGYTGVAVSSKTEPEQPVTAAVRGPLEPIQKEQIESNEDKKEIDPENNFRDTICPNCVIYDLVGCDHCGLYAYGWKHPQYKFKVTKIS
jgi:hypothetical protein